MVNATLKQLDAWYNEPSQGGDRPKLLSKLALLELCGWIEGEFDRLVLVAQDGRLDDVDWVTKDVLKGIHGFTYTDHLRPMITRLVGEVFARRIEEKMEANFPGEMERLRSILGTLWKQRCSFAHADVAAIVASQQNFSAPSWSLNQHRIIKKLIEHYEQAMKDALSSI